jgi:hypothetical protein
MFLVSTTSPNSAKAGACLVDEQKWAFQKPPFPHFATNNLVFSSERSAIISHESSSRTIVPTGTFKIRSGALAP